ncbi:DUF3368 domain-containing protein [Trichothermofontia sp.]
MLIVSNTSPLSNLALIGEFELLQRIYSRILISPIVYSELLCLLEIEQTILNTVNIGWLGIEQPTNLSLLQTLNQVLDLGEASAIAIAIDINADRLLIDERIGRSIALYYGLNIRGILGILIHAKNQKLIPNTKTLLDRLINQAGFRVSQALYTRTLQESGEL